MDDEIDQSKISKKLEEFESAWSNLFPISALLNYVEGVVEPTRTELLYHLIAIDLELRRDSKLNPLQTDYAQIFPEAKELIAACFENCAEPSFEDLAKPPNEIDGYYHISQIGTGGFGEVHLYEHRELKRNVAIKFPKPKFRNDAEALFRLKKEAQMAANLNHLGIVRILHPISDRSTPLAIVMEYVEGKTLESWMESTPLENRNMTEIAGLVSKIADALAYAHSYKHRSADSGRQGIMHRDIKPGNIMLEKVSADDRALKPDDPSVISLNGAFYRPKIVDFGLAETQSFNSSLRGNVAGTPAYMSPEQTRGEADLLSVHSDVWSLGVVLYELLTGVKPFPGHTNDEIILQIQKYNERPPSVVNLAIPPAFGDICTKRLNKNARERGTARQFANDLSNWAHDPKAKRNSVDAMKAYLETAVAHATRVPTYFPTGKMPEIRVSVRVRTKVMPYDEALETVREQQRRSGDRDEEKIYQTRHHHDNENESGGKQREYSEEIVDWDSQIRTTLQRGLLLGDPGMGKSWLLKTEMQRLAQTALEQLERGQNQDLTFPVFISLPDLANALAAPEQPTFPAAIATVLRSQGADELAIEQILNVIGTPDCNLLLDAWDEVSQEKIGRLRECIQSWISRNPQAHFLITSRLVGRPTIPLWRFSENSLTDRELELQPFGEREIQIFIPQYFAARPEWGQMMTSQLGESIQLRGLARIPLLLSLLCWHVYRQLSRMPAIDAANPESLNLKNLERNDLYRELLPALLNGVWHDNFVPLNEVELDNSLRLLEKVAFDLLRAGKQRFSLRELREVLGKAAETIKMTDSTLDDLESRIVAKDGLIIPAGIGGPDTPLLFLHLTLHEFLAARYLYQSLKTDDAQVWRVLAELWDHPDFPEVWKLFALEGRREVGHIQRMVETVLANAHPLDKYLFRHYETALGWIGLAAWSFEARSSAYAEVIRWAQSVICGYKPKSWAIKILRRLRWLHPSLWAIARRSTVTRVLDVLRRWRAPIDDTMISGLLILLDLREREIGFLEVEVLSMRAHEEKVEQALLQRIDPDPEKYLPVILGLSSQAHKPHILRRLLALFQTDSYLARDAVEAVASKAHLREVQLALIKMVDDTTPGSGYHEIVARRNAIKALGSQAHLLVVRECLLRWLVDEQHEVRRAAAKALESQSYLPIVQEALLRRLKDEDFDVRESAVASLSSQVHVPVVMESLILCLTDSSEFVRRAAVRAISSQAGEPRVRQTLMLLLADEDAGVGIVAIGALRSQVKLDDVRDAVMKTLKDDNLQTAAVGTLSSQSHVEDVRHEVVNLISNNSDGILTNAAAKMLASQSHRSDVQQVLLNLLESRILYRELAAIEALVSQMHIPAIRHKVMRMLGLFGSFDKDVQRASVEALCRQIHLPGVKRLLMKRTCGDSRVPVVRALSQQVDDPKVRRFLIDRLADFSDDVFEAATNALRAAIVREKFKFR